MDICLYISDQHAYEVQAYAGNGVIRTPNLDRIAKEGIVYDNAYCAYPVCVPSRMSMLTGQFASKIGVMSNHGSLNSNIPTFLHSLDIAGYETVLCGRMHFVGPDQRHGFLKRIAGDITQIYNNRPGRISIERGVHDKTPQGGPNSISLVGGGNSPSLEYDRYVISKALDYLKQDHEKDQFLCVGTYAPHHPFVAPKELFDYYYDKVDVPEASFDYLEHPALKNSFRDTDPEIVRAVRAAYYGMVEFEDQLIGHVYDAFNDYLKRNHKEGVFLYLSDHGEHEGYRGMYGKNTFYECSVHVPLLMAGSGIEKGARRKGCVSLLDVAPTILELAGAESLPVQDGVSLLKDDDRSRIVFGECGGNITMNRFSYGQMAVSDGFKYIHYESYDGQDVLYHLEKDKEESVNVIASYPKEAKRLKEAIEERLCKDIGRLKENAKAEKQYMKVLSRCDFDSEELWHCPENARQKPSPCFSSKKTVETWIEELKNTKEEA